MGMDSASAGYSWGHSGSGQWLLSTAVSTFSLVRIMLVSLLLKISILRLLVSTLLKGRFVIFLVFVFVIVMRILGQGHGKRAEGGGRTALWVVRGGICFRGLVVNRHANMLGVLFRHRALRVLKVRYCNGRTSRVVRVKRTIVGYGGALRCFIGAAFGCPAVTRTCHITTLGNLGHIFWIMVGARFVDGGTPGCGMNTFFVY